MSFSSCSSSSALYSAYFCGLRSRDPKHCISSGFWSYALLFQNIVYQADSDPMHCCSKTLYIQRILIPCTAVRMIKSLCSGSWSYIHCCSYDKVLIQRILIPCTAVRMICPYPALPVPRHCSWLHSSQVPAASLSPVLQAAHGSFAALHPTSPHSEPAI